MSWGWESHTSGAEGPGDLNPRQELSLQSHKKPRVMWAGPNSHMKHSVWIKRQQEPAVTPSILTSASAQTSKPLPSVQRTNHQQGQTSGLGDKTHISQRSVSRSAQSSPVFPVGGSLSIQRRRSIPHFKMTKLDKATKCYSSHTQLAEDGKTPLLCNEWSRTLASLYQLYS